MFAIYAKKKRADKISKQVLSTLIAEYKASGLDFGLPPEDCFDKTDGFKIEKKCLTSGIKMCSNGFLNNKGMLSFPFVSEELNIEKIDFSSQEDYLKYSELSGSESAKDKIKTELVRAHYSTCHLLAKRGIDFKPKQISFKGYKNPQWLANLAYGSAQFAYPSLIDSESIDDKCLDKAGVPKNIMSKVNRLKNDYELGYPLNEIEKGVKNCQSAINSICSQTYFLKEKLIYVYSTQGCTTREVTKEDIESDLQRWKERGMEEAAVIQHSTLLDQINVCLLASSHGYGWHYVPPKGPGPNCKKQSAK